MVDYLQYGFDSNPGQRWVSVPEAQEGGRSHNDVSMVSQSRAYKIMLHGQITRGVVFMHAVINAACYDDKLELLQSTFNTVSGNLRQTLWTSFYAYKDLFPIPNYREAMQAAFPESTGVDKGPFEAWRLMLDKDNIDMGVYYFMDNEAWLRERGYVFWDWERIVEHNLAKVITELGHEVDDPFDDQELEDMEESWDERSLVWQKGGRGYWSKDDLSRIEWPPGREPQPQV